MYAHAGILEALYHRERSGEGSAIAVSLFDCLAEWMTVPLLHYEYGGKAPERVGLKHPSIAPYGAFASADGKQVVISIQNEREWRNLCEKVLERSEMATDSRFDSNTRRVANRPALDGEIAAILGRIPQAELLSKLSQAKIAFASVNWVAELSRHQQLRRAGVNSPTGPLDLVAPPVRSGNEEFNAGPVPSVGQHSRSIREEFAG
jgi:crotonobetainyl-CoA:carnitine CoA-transferase CaiB-like acyl-CoA transferase